MDSDSSTFKHWHNSSNGNAKEASGTFEQDQIWVDIVQPYKFIDETNVVATEYLTGVSANNDWNPGPDHGEQGQHRMQYDPVHSTEGNKADSSIQTPLVPQVSELSADAQNMRGVDRQDILISPNNLNIAPSVGYPATFEAEGLEDVNCQVHFPEFSGVLDDASGNQHINNPNSWVAITQREGAAGRALLSMRNRSLSTWETRSRSTNSPSSFDCSPSEWSVNSVVPSPVDLAAPAVQGAAILRISKEETDLLRQFSTEVGTWMDLSDLSETFSKKVCRLAVHDPLLKSASIACATKQQYLVGKLEDGMEIAQKNYDVAISLLINRLWDSDEQLAEYGFAAIVICSCYEMLDAPTANWQRHLDGVFSFGRVQKVNGSSGGIAQAAFWSIARQEVVCALISRSKLRLDPDHWAVDIENIGQEGREDLVNNQ
ncbi:unnamed protein product [Penicillium pancosmium]